MLDQSINVFGMLHCVESNARHTDSVLSASVDEEAFHHMPDVTYGADLIEDDLPTNHEYLDESTRRPNTKATVQRQNSEDMISPALEDSVLEVKKSELGTETIRILMDEPFDVEPNYWDNLPVISQGPEEE